MGTGCRRVGLTTARPTWPVRSPPRAPTSRWRGRPRGAGIGRRMCSPSAALVCIWPIRWGSPGTRTRRVKNDIRDATLLADLLRLGRLPEAWVAPPEVRELREIVRYRAKLVRLR